MQLNTRPEPVDVTLERAALVVVDMQNAFASRGGLLDIAGHDVSGAAGVVERLARLTAAARACGMPVVYLQSGYKADLSNGGGAGSPNPRKETALRLMCARPELAGTLLVEGTWDFAIVEALAPQPGDLVVLKTRYSGFAGTQLDGQLRARDLKYLFFTGIAANVCVESTLRDAYFHEYWPVLVSDGTMQAGPPAQQQATLYNVESFFGWTLTAAGLLDALETSAAAGA